MKAHGGGSIINTSSTAGVNAGAGLITYRATKAAVIHISRSIALDLAQYNIRVNCLLPGQIRTAMTTYDMDTVMKYTQPLPRYGQAEDVANAAVFLASDRAAHITGVVLPVDGGTVAGPPASQIKLMLGNSPPRRVTQAGFELEVERGEAAEEVGGEVVPVAVAGRAVGALGDGDVRGAFEQPVDRDPPLGAGEVSARAVVGALPERQVVAGVGTGDVELGRVLEPAGIAVGRPRQEQHRAPGGDGDARHRRRDLGHPELGPQRALVAQRLLDEVRDQLSVVAQGVLDVGPLAEHPEREREQPHRGLLAAGEEVGREQRHVVDVRRRSVGELWRWPSPS